VFIKGVQNFIFFFAFTLIYAFFLADFSWANNASKLSFDSQIQSSFEKKDFSILRNQKLSNKEKIVLIKSFVGSFTESDWLLWPASLKENSSELSEARQSLDAISIIDFELAVYLDTAAYLFTNIRANPSVDLEFEHTKFVDKSADFYGFKKSSSTLPRDMVDAEILKDAAFVDAADDFRYSIFRNKIEEGLIDEKSIFGILEFFSSKNASKVARELIKHASSSLSSSSRTSAVESISPDNIIFSLIDSDEGLKRNLSNLYALVAVDFIDLGQYKRAEQALSVSKEISNDIKSQKLISNFLESTAAKSVDTEKESSGFLSSGSFLGSIASKVKTPSGFSYFNNLAKFLLTLIFILLPVFLVLYFLRKLRFRKAGKNKKSSKKSESEVSSAEIEFDDLELSPGKEQPKNSEPEKRQANR